MTSHVLVADDNAAICRLLCDALQQEEFTVDVVHNGLDALRVLESDRSPSMVLLDWKMPGLDGLEVCRRVRAGASAAQAHVCLISGSQSDADILSCYEAGVDEFIPKPFDPRAVAARLRAVCRRGESGGGLRATLRQGLAAGTGEMVVRSGARVGRVLLHRGRVVWVHAPGAAGLMPLLNRLGVDAGTVHLAFEECRQRQQPFLDTLVDWGMVPRAALREQIRAEFTARWAELLRWPSSTAFFVPDAGGLRSTFSFTPAELEGPRRDPAQALPPLSVPGLAPSVLPAYLSRVVVAAAQIEGVVSAGVIELQSGQRCMQLGTASLDGMLRIASQLFLLDEGKPLEETLLSTDDRHLVLRRLDRDHVLYVCLDRARNPNLGLVRLVLSQRIRELSAD